MGLAESLRAAVGHIGGAYDYDEYDDAAFDGPPECPSDEEPRRARGGTDFDEIYRDTSSQYSPRRREWDAPPLALVRPPRLEFALVAPGDFDDAQKIADGLRAGNPVIVDLTDCARDLSIRMIDFCSGLTYAIEGSLQYVGEAVVLLMPHTLELSSEAPGQIREARFLNQI